MSEDAIASERKRAERFAHALACLALAAKDVRPDGMGYLALHGTYARFRDAIADAMAAEGSREEAVRSSAFVTVPTEQLRIVLGYFAAANWPDTRIGNAAYMLNDIAARQGRGLS